MGLQVEPLLTRARTRRLRVMMIGELKLIAEALMPPR